MRKIALIFLSIAGLQSAMAFNGDSLNFVPDQAAYSAFDTIKKYLRIDFVHTPNSGLGYVLPLDELRNNQFTSRHWNNAPFCKKLMERLCLPAAGGGDERLQYYVSVVLSMTKERIRFHLVNDGTAAMTNATMNRYNICNDGNNPGRSWPCAQVLGRQSAFLDEHCGPAPASRWGGEFSIGEFFLSTYDANQNYVRGTIVHELVHTQDWTDLRFHVYRSSAGFLHYGRDETHFITEVLPSREYTFAEGLANSFSFNYENGVDSSIRTLLMGNIFQVEIPPATPVAAATCGVTPTLSPDIFIFNQLIQQNIIPIDTISVGSGATATQYARFNTRDLTPSALFYHNEGVLATIIGKNLQYVSTNRFLAVFYAENMVRFFLNVLEPDAYTGILRTLARSAVPSSVSRDLRQMEELNVQPPNECMYPYALVDLLTYGRLQTEQDFKNIFGYTFTGFGGAPVTASRVSDYWIRNYLRVKTQLLMDANGQMVQDADEIARRLGLRKVGLQ